MLVLLASELGELSLQTILTTCGRIQAPKVETARKTQSDEEDGEPNESEVKRDEIGSPKLDRERRTCELRQIVLRRAAATHKIVCSDVLCVDCVVSRNVAGCVTRVAADFAVGNVDRCEVDIAAACEVDWNAHVHFMARNANFLRRDAAVRVLRAHIREQRGYTGDDTRN